MAHVMGVSEFGGLKDKKLKAALIGEAKVNDKPAIGVKISKEGQKDVDFYFDKKTGLVAKIERRARDVQSGQEVTEERFITEYQDSGGRKVAKKLVVHRDGKKFLEAEVTEVKLLEKLDDSEFAQP
jgi:hypothetical protein